MKPARDWLIEGRHCHESGDCQRAFQCYRMALQMDPGDPETKNLLGLLLHHTSAHEEALEWMLQASASDGTNAVYQNHLGIIYRALGRHDQAGAAYRRALKLDPDNSDYWFNLGNLEKDAKNMEEAARCFERSLELKPGAADALYNLGVVCSAVEGRLERAERCYLDAVALKPEYSEAHINLGVLVQNRSQYAEALACFDEALRHRPDFAEARMNRALLLLLLGRFGEGWEDYEWRWRCNSFGSVLRPSDVQPAWAGEDLGQKTILVYAEQGLGDSIFFARYLPLLAQKAKAVVLECQPALKRLFVGLGGVTKIIAAGEPLPAFDCHIPLGSLPRMFGTAAHNIPGVTPYLPVPFIGQIAMPETSQGRLKVGLVWAGNPLFLEDRNRSLSVKEILPLLDIAQIAWFNLLVGPRKNELASLHSTDSWHDLTDGIRDFADTAALIAHLDLVITVDTSVAHLAGAMGKPVWTLIPSVPDWRWQLERDDSAWYPTMRLFRKTGPEVDWQGVVERVGVALQSLLAGKSETVGTSIERAGAADECWRRASDCLREGRLEAALSALMTTARLDPRRKGVHMAAGAILKKLGRLEESLDHCRAEADLDPQNPDAHQNHALVLLALERYREAIDAGLNAVDLKPDYADAWQHIGVAWVQVNDLNRAIWCFERAIEIDPANPEPHWHLSTALLACGQFERGWKEFEWRWLMPGFTTPYSRFHKPAWDGSDPRGKTILLHAEQGAGDTIQFIRYAALLARLGAIVIVGCDKELVPVIRSASGVSQVASNQRELPDFDFHAPLMGMPQLMGTLVEGIPNDVPYLFADPSRAPLPQRKASGRRVGLIWAGNPKHNQDRRRSMPARCLVPLLCEPGIQFFSLQVGATSRELAGVAGAESLIDLSPLLTDYGDTASAMAQLDLVISVDTACAHLAGALGRPVWLLLPNPGEWRWFVDRSDSPWYPTMRVFRQTLPADWDELIQRVRAELQAWAAPPMPAKADDVHYFRDQGIASHAQGRITDAIHWFEKAVAVNANVVESRFNLGLSLHHAGRHAESVEQLRTAAQLAPGEPRIHLNLGSALLDAGSFEDSIKHFDAALALRPDYAEAHNNRGAWMQAQGRLSEAIASYQSAIELQPDYVDAHLNLATVLRETGRLSESIAWHRKVALMSPGLPENHSNLGFALLMDGQYEEGWREYEWRLKTKARIERDAPPNRPRWEGEPLEGKTILLKAEQGMGDSIQFIRYAPLIAQAGAKVIVECPSALRRLLGAVEGVKAAFATGEPLPAFDVYAPLPSLPLIFRTDLSRIPRDVPYLQAGGNRRARSREATLHAGLVWAGNPGHKNDRHRSIPIWFLEPLFQIDGVIWHNLQCGARAADWSSLPGKTVNDSAVFGDFMDTADAIQKLDLVITVDTAVAHLAGALGANAWVMLPFAPDWRWLLDRSDSPWYPTLKLFRQPSPGDWPAVIERIAESLNTRAQGSA